MQQNVVNKLQLNKRKHFHVYKKKNNIHSWNPRWYMHNCIIHDFRDENNKITDGTSSVIVTDSGDILTRN